MRIITVMKENSSLIAKPNQTNADSRYYNRRTHFIWHSKGV